MKRREAAWVMAAAVLAAGQSVTPRYFTPVEWKKLKELAELIVPGSGQARVAEFADLVVVESGRTVQQRWRKGLAMVPEERMAAWLEQAAADERGAASEAGRFFVIMKQMTILAYYTSEPGIRGELGYRGHEVLGRFPGCEA